MEDQSRFFLHGKYSPKRTYSSPNQTCSDAASKNFVSGPGQSLRKQSANSSFISNLDDLQSLKRLRKPCQPQSHAKYHGKIEFRLLHSRLEECGTRSCLCDPVEPACETSVELPLPVVEGQPGNEPSKSRVRAHPRRQLGMETNPSPFAIVFLLGKSMVKLPQALHPLVRRRWKNYHTDWVGVDLSYDSDTNETLWE